MSKTRSMLKKILIAIVIIGIVAGSIYLCFQFGLFDDKLTATYDTTHTVYVGDEVDSIKPYLTVNKANWLGSKTEVSDYALSGDFSHTGTSTVEISYQKLATTVEVTVNNKPSTPKTYTIMLDYNGADGGNVQETITITYGQAVGTLPTPTKINNTFDGWYYDDTLITAQTVWNTDTDEPITFVAKWTENVVEPETFTVTFVADGTTVATRTYTVENKTIDEPQVPTKTGYNGVWEEYTLTTGDLTVNAVYAAKQYTITLDYNGATDGNTQQSITVTYNQTIGTLPTPTKDGYAFTGWYLGETPVTPTFVWTIDNDAQQMLVAKWQDNTVEMDTWTVTFVADGKVVDTQTYTTDNKTITEPQVPAKTGYNGVWEDYILTTGNVVVNAVYTAIQYTVTFKADNAIVDTQTYTVENKNIVVPQVPVKTGYNGAWENYTLTAGDLTVNAVYTAKQYVVTLDYNGADGNNTQQTITVMFNQLVGELPNPTKVGSSFINWTYGGNVIMSDTVWNIDTDIQITFVATWELQKFTVTFESNGGSAVAAITDVEHNSHIAKPTNPTKESNVFRRWYKDELLQNAWNFEADTVTGNITLYAKWQDITVATEGLEYMLKIDGESYNVTGIGAATDTDIVIASVYNDKPVTGISFAFEDCRELTSVTIPNSVTWISNEAFAKCSSLEKIEMPDSVTSIGSYAFFACYSLTSIEIPNGVAKIGDHAFYGCDSITKVTIGNSVTSISDATFLNCRSLTSVTLNNSVTSIGVSAFAGCSSLTSIEIPNSVTSIGVSAFAGCNSLTSIEIPNSVTSIGVSAFAGCNSLESITLPFVGSSAKTSNDVDRYPFGYIFGQSSANGIATTQWYYKSGQWTPVKITYYIPTSLKSVIITGDGMIAGAFRNCSSLAEVTLGNNVTYIEISAFEDCSGLTSITIGNSVMSIGQNAFRLCSGLTNVTIPDSVTTIYDSAFYGCSKLSTIQFTGTISQWNNVTKGSNWKYNVPATKVICSDGEVAL